jgi:glycolate oxidase iron-sulfur subunit
MKHYGALLADDADWAERAAVFGKQVFDFSEYLVRFAFDDLRPALGPLEVAQPICWDDPCHLCHGQGIRDEPRALLDALSIERVELKESESCCGSAGLYSVLRPLDSRAILAPRLAALKATGARTLVSANPGCQLQWSGGLRQTGSEVEVLHIAELLERALAHGRESGE